MLVDIDYKPNLLCSSYVFNHVLLKLDNSKDKTFAMFSKGISKSYLKYWYDQYEESVCESRIKIDESKIGAIYGMMTTDLLHLDHSVNPLYVECIASLKEHINKRWLTELKKY